MKLMTARTFSILTALALLGCGPVFGQLPNALAANVPFDFVVGEKVMPAGVYTFTLSGATQNVIVIQSRDGKACLMSNVYGGSTNSLRDGTRLYFNRYGDTYFLNELFLVGYSSGRALGRSEREREMIAQAGTARRVVLIPGHRN